jgi:septal ring factor EnvC (AmiA/AmiB activator)
MNKNLKWAVLSLGVLGMGMAMPSCPGQQAMQQQIDSLQTSSTEMTKKVQALNAQVTALQKDMDQAKQLLPQMTNVIQAQKAALDQIEATVRDMRGSKGGAKKKK